MIVLRLRVVPLDANDLSRSDRLSVLRGQLTLIRMRVEQGIPIDIQPLVKAEELARILELSE